MKKKKAFILKHILLLLITLFTFIVYIQTYHQIQLKNLSYHLELEKQKIVELILYSYFMNHNSNESKQIQTSEVNLEYTITKQEDSKELSARICIKECYNWSLKQDLETKYIISNEYSSIE